jgi:hypothetical protein
MKLLFIEKVKLSLESTFVTIWFPSCIFLAIYFLLFNPLLLSLIVFSFLIHYNLN